ncbi:MAG: GNAT family N-acetyltransferase [Candidatus Poribacteria bacterium]|nr:GNAT family N-acetyltransferase [Candidatus Poribacteria bacterium]
MRSAPPLLTERLLLRSLTLEDAADVQRLAGDRDVAATLSNMPHPYEDGMAEEWMRACSDKFEKDEALNFAITLKIDKNLIGGMELRLDQKNENAELGYWIGKPYWNCGYATEAAGAVVAYGFEVLKLNRIHAKHFKRNPASGRVLEKIGMRYEGCFRQHIKKWDNFEDLMGYGMLKADFNSLAPISSEDI